jgi:hypothetical protein
LLTQLSLNVIVLKKIVNSNTPNKKKLTSSGIYINYSQFYELQEASLSVLLFSIKDIFKETEDVKVAKSDCTDLIKLILILINVHINDNI